MLNTSSMKHGVRKVGIPYFPTTCRGNSNHKVCKDISQYFYNKIANNEELTPVDARNFNNFVRDSSSYYYGDCTTVQGSHIKTVAYHFLKKYEFTQYSSLHKFLGMLTCDKIVDILIAQQGLIKETKEGESYGIMLSKINSQVLRYVFKNKGVVDYILSVYYSLNQLTKINREYFRYIITNNYNEVSKLLKDKNNTITQVTNFIKYLVECGGGGGPETTEYFLILKNDLKYASPLYEPHMLNIFNTKLRQNDINVESTLQRIVEILTKEIVKKHINNNYKDIFLNSHGNKSSLQNLKTNAHLEHPKILARALFYGLQVTKEVVLYLIEKYIHVNNLEKYGIDIDNDIMKACSKHRYYPYKYINKPPTEVLETECTYDSNYDNLVYLKELGGEFNDKCLINICKTRASGRSIKFLVEKCGVQVTNECIQKFEIANDFTGLSLLLKKYDDSKPKKVEEKVAELNTNCVMKIEKNELKHDITDDDYVFDLRKKVVKFFSFKDIKYSYTELKLKFYEYLIENNLTIGQYFVVNTKLSNFFKLNQCVIINCNDIDNILTYFVKNFYDAKEEESKKVVKKRTITKKKESKKEDNGEEKENKDEDNIIIEEDLDTEELWMQTEIAKIEQIEKLKVDN